MWTRVYFNKLNRFSRARSLSKVADVVSSSETPAATDALDSDTNDGKLINISRLRQRHRMFAESRIAPATYEWEKEKWAKGMRFGKYGVASGVSPSELWPAVEEIEEMEAFKLYKTYSEAAEAARAEAKAAVAKAEGRLKEVAKNEAAHQEKLSKYETSLQKVEKEKSEAEEKLERRILEIQEYFGYRIDPKDPRFEVMLAQKDAEEKKAQKEAKRLEKLRKTVATVASDSGSASR